MRSAILGNDLKGFIHSYYRFISPSERALIGQDVIILVYDSHEKTFSLLSELRELYAMFHFKLSIPPLSLSL